MKTDREFMDRTFPKIDKASLNKTTIIEFCEVNNRKPSRHSKDLIEKKLHQAMTRYCSPSNDCYDSVFVEKINTMNLGTATLNKTKIIEFCNVNNRKPSRASKDPIEKKLGQAMASYCYPSHDCYDPAFKKQLDKLCKKLGIK
jgi:hypothetical protein